MTTTKELWVSTPAYLLKSGDKVKLAQGADPQAVLVATVSRLEFHEGIPEVHVPPCWTVHFEEENCVPISADFEGKIDRFVKVSPGVVDILEMWHTSEYQDKSCSEQGEMLFYEVCKLEFLWNATEGCSMLRFLADLKAAGLRSQLLDSLHATCGYRDCVDCFTIVALELKRFGNRGDINALMEALYDHKQEQEQEQEQEG